MPVKIIKKGDKYEVKTPNMAHAKGTTKAKAESQARLLRAVEHGWKPSGSPMKSNPHSSANSEISKSKR